MMFVCKREEEQNAGGRLLERDRKATRWRILVYICICCVAHNSMTRMRKPYSTAIN